MEIQRLNRYTQAQFEDLRKLMLQLNDAVDFTQMDLMNVLADKNSFLYVIVDEGHIVGCASLCVFHSPTGAKASIEDVVVLDSYRGRGLGRSLMEHVIGQAELMAPIELHLTSNPKRVAANHLYQSLGFMRKETNSYRMMLCPAVE